MTNIYETTDAPSYVSQWTNGITPYNIGRGDTFFGTFDSNAQSDDSDAIILNLTAGETYTIIYDGLDFQANNYEILLTNANTTSSAPNFKDYIDPDNATYFIQFGTGPSTTLTQVSNSTFTMTFTANYSGVWATEIYGGYGSSSPVPYTISIDCQTNQMSATHGNDLITGTHMADHISLLKGHDYFVGGDCNDTVRGGKGNDTIYGEGGNDVMTGNRGRDKLYGGDGDDKLSGRQGNDKLYGDTGEDTLLGNQGKDKLWGGAGDDHLNGNSGNDTLNGEDGADQLRGGGGADRLYGGSGDDTLYGGKGNDVLFGGAGSDVFILTSTAGVERIKDFEDGIDKIDVPTVGSGYAISQVGSHVLIEMGNADMILENTNISDISNADFI